MLTTHNDVMDVKCTVPEESEISWVRNIFPSTLILRPKSARKFRDAVHQAKKAQSAAVIGDPVLSTGWEKSPQLRK